MPWNGLLYAANAAHHRAFDRDFLRGLSLAPDARILDLGCGVGELTERLADMVPDGHVLGIDASPSMIEAASARSRPNLSFAVLSAQQVDLPSVGGRPFHLVVSTAMLHWIPEDQHPGVLSAIRRVLRPGGVFRAEFGGHGQIAVARRILNTESARLGGPVDPYYFPDADTYRRLLAEAGFHFEPVDVRTVPQRRPLPDQPAVIGWLRSQVSIAWETGLPDHAVDRFRARVERRATEELRRADGSYDQDYIRLYVTARAPQGSSAPRRELTRNG